LLPPNSSAADPRHHHQLAPLHARLSRDAAERWNRPDILGVLLAAYSLLLRSPSTGVASPGSRHAAAATSTTTTPDLRRAWRECLEAPAELKSFTFARMGLVPAVLSAGTDPSEHDILGASRRPRHDRGGVCDTTEFLVSVLARFASNYLSVLSEYGDLPISRVKWEQDAEASLRLRRSHQEQQRQFQAWSGTNDVVDGTAEVIPASVDLAQRPDCMDDVIAFAAAVAALGPHSAAAFWSYHDEPSQPPSESNASNPADAARLAPSLALSALDRQQEDDESLLPCFLTFLASLAQADGGAAAVHHMLSASVEDGRKGQVTWGSIFGILRWYTQQLAKDDFGGSPGIKSAATLHTSTSYYYADDEATDATSDSTWARDGTDDRQSVTKPRDLTEASAFVLMSHLRLVSSVCWGCPAARAALLGSEAAMQGAAIDQDSTLVVLFSLAVAPLPSDLRGAVFTALAAILTAHPSDAAFTKIQASASTAWQILDQCQILPIYLLDQYPSSFEKNSKNYVGLRFPPSSMALVSHTTTIN
jgi:Nuclear pore complex scaffold, nucleoporins 186/192/205